MDLSKILSISGKAGLFKMMAQTKNGVVVESIIDEKRFTAFGNEQISSLEEISIFTEDEDLPLLEVFKLIFKKLEGEKALSHKSSNKELKEFFEEVLPSYDKERVYVSDIKKVINWYNLLTVNEFFDFPEEDENKSSEDNEESKPDEKTEKPEEANDEVKPEETETKSDKEEIKE
jgi:hypothetical protein